MSNALQDRGSAEWLLNLTEAYQMLLSKGLWGPLWKIIPFQTRRALQTFSRGKRFFLPHCQIIRLQKISHFVLEMNWMHLKGKQEGDSASNCRVAAQLDSPVSAPDITRAKAESGKDGLLNAPGGVGSPLGYINLSNWKLTELVK